LVINGLVYFIYGLLSGHFRRAFFPVGPRAFLRDLLAALSFRLPHHPGAYNGVQKALYLGVLTAGIVMALSGLAIWKPGQFQELAGPFGGCDIARFVHSVGMWAMVLFLTWQISFVIVVPKTRPSMITGRAPTHPDAANPM